MFREVVAAVDGSPSSFRAADMGATLASSQNGSIDLIAVVEPRGEIAHRFKIGREEEENVRQRARADLRSAEAMIGGKVPVGRREVVEGPVIDAVLEACGTVGERLLCVGAGRHNLRLGSVSAAAVRRAECPVLVVREGVSTGPRIERILVGFDGSRGSRLAVEAAGAIAASLGSAVSLIQVLKPSWPMPGRGLALSAPEVEALAGEPERQELAEARRSLEASGCVVERAGFELGQAPDRLLALADTLDVDLIVVGAHGRSPARRWILGGVSDHVSSRSPRPVLVMR